MVLWQSLRAKTLVAPSKLFTYMTLTSSATWALRDDDDHSIGAHLAGLGERFDIARSGRQALPGGRA